MHGRSGERDHDNNSVGKSCIPPTNKNTLHPNTHEGYRGSISTCNPPPFSSLPSQPMPTNNHSWIWLSHPNPVPSTSLSIHILLARHTNERRLILLSQHPISPLFEGRRRLSYPILNLSIKHNSTTPLFLNIKYDWVFHQS